MSRILVSSVDPWSERVGSDTLSSLVSSYPASQIASLNIRVQKSDSKVAGRYFHIIEERVIKSIFNKTIVTGESYLPIDSSNEKEKEVEERRYGKKKPCRSFLVLLRELAWKFGRWKTQELDDFIQDFAPDALFFPIEGYIHFNRINQYIINKFHPKRVVGYMWDDNFTYKQHPYNVLYLIHRFWLRKSVKALVSNCDEVFAISPKLKRELDAEYGIESILLTKPIKDSVSYNPYAPSDPIRILYTGKLIIGRDRTIADIADAMREINKEGKKVALDIYTNTEVTEKVKERIEKSEGCRVHGFVPQQEVFQIQQKADVLLFAEALSKGDMSARLSFSTKITDYLSAGKCIWAVGNKELAPIEYMKEYDAALVSTCKEEVRKQLRNLIENKGIIPYYAQKAYECGRTNHSKEMIQSRFQGAIFGTEWRSNN